jgi:ribosomal protein S18 acetylase RimI-like enzyme
MHFTTYTERFAEQAVDLIVSNYRDISSTHRAFNTNSLAPATLTSDLTEWTDNGASVVAHEDGILRGVIVGRFIDFYQSPTAFFSPDWGHAVADSKHDRNWNEMYAWLTRSGQIDSSSVHAIGIYASDHTLKSALTNLEFGVHTVEGVLELPSQPKTNVEIEGFLVRAAGSHDIPGIIELDKQLWQHLSHPPVSLGINLANYPDNNPKYSLPRDGSYIAIAEIDHQIVGFISCQLGSQEFSGLSNPQIPAINGAFVDVSHRNTNIARALLDDIFDHARTISAPYVTVDFESTNIEGAGFWRSRQFTPLGYGMTRRVPT